MPLLLNPLMIATLAAIMTASYTLAAGQYTLTTNYIAASSQLSTSNLQKIQQSYAKLKYVKLAAE